MNIRFPHDPPQYNNLKLTFTALVDDKCINCSITAEALEDHFGAQSAREEDVLQAFAHHRREIENAASRMLREIGPTPVILHSGYFRFCG